MGELAETKLVGGPRDGITVAVPLTHNNVYVWLGYGYGVYVRVDNATAVFDHEEVKTK